MYTRIIGDIKRRLQSGFKIGAPIVLGLLFLILLTNMFYYGGERESVAARAEAELIHVSLANAVQPAKKNSTAIISVTDDDLFRLETAPSEKLWDAHINEYARILEKISQAEPAEVIVGWLAGAHKVDEEYLRPFTRVIDRYNLHKKVSIALPYLITGPIPEHLKRKYMFYDGDDCVYEVIKFCTYVPEWDWIIQGIADRFGGKLPEGHVSTNLPHKLPNFLTNLPARSSIREYSFNSFLRDDTAAVKDGVYFIGNAVTQRLKFRDSKYVLQRTYTVENDLRRSLLVDGTPFHVFWAQLAQMFIDKRTIAVGSPTMTKYSIVVLATIIIYALYSFGPPVAFGVIVVCAALFPFANAITIRSLGFYLPQFDIIYYGLVVFVFSTFLMISYSTYRRLRVAAQSREFQSTADIKGNFISLISHNLNTPIAKIIGLLSILRMSPHLASQSTIIGECGRLIGKIHLSVRSVLMSTSVDQGAISHAPVSVKQLIHRFESEVSGTVKRMGLEHEIEISTDTGETLRLDAKVVGQALGCMLGLLEPFAPLKTRIMIRLPKNEDEPAELVVQAPLDNEDLRRRFEKLCCSTAGDDFYRRILKQFIATATGLYQGSWKAELMAGVVEIRSYWRFKN